MDVKGLVYESYHKGAQELLYVIPFVAKIIESAAKSRVCACSSDLQSGFVQTMESPGILLFRIPGLESPGILKQCYCIFLFLFRVVAKIKQYFLIQYHLLDQTDY